jgi:hypothetical protein
MELFTSTRSKGIDRNNIGSGITMDQPAEVQRDGSASPFDILFNTNLSSMKLHIFSDHEMFPLLVRDPETANL